MPLRFLAFLLAAWGLFQSGLLSCSTIAPTPPDAGTTASAPDTGDGGDASPAPDPGPSPTGAPGNGPAPEPPPFNSRTVVRLTDNDDEESWGQNNFWSTTSRGRILWQRILASGETEIVLGDKSGGRKTLRTSPEDVDFMALGSGAGADDVLASWREDLSDTFVGDGSANTNLGPHNQEENSIADGCLYYRDSTNGPLNNEIARYSKADGNDVVSQASFSDSEPVTSACEAVWLRDGNLVHFDGLNITEVAAGPFDGFDMRNGRIVYSRGGDVFLYDTVSVSPAPINLTNASADSNRNPKTDGDSIVFVRDSCIGS
jgi:hypothetical protein